MTAQILARLNGQKIAACDDARLMDATNGHLPQAFASDLAVQRATSATPKNRAQWLARPLEEVLPRLAVCFPAATNDSDYLASLGAALQVATDGKRMHITAASDVEMAHTAERGESDPNWLSAAPNKWGGATAWQAVTLGRAVAYLDADKAIRIQVEILGLRDFCEVDAAYLIDAAPIMSKGQFQTAERDYQGFDIGGGEIVPNEFLAFQQDRYGPLVIKSRYGAVVLMPMR